MPEERIELEAFLEELVSAIERRLGEQDKRLERLEKALSSRGGSLKIDKSVLRVLRGE